MCLHRQKLGIFETKAGQALTAVDGSLTTASTLLTRNQELLSQLKALNEQIQGNTELSQQFSALIAQKDFRTGEPECVPSGTGGFIEEWQ